MHTAKGITMTVLDIYDQLKAAGLDPIKGLIANVSKIFQLPQEAVNQLKGKMIAESFKFHCQYNPFYRNVCNEKGIAPKDVNGYDDLIKIPLVPIAKYKSAASHELLTVPLPRIEHEMRSTGTSGIPSIARRCSETMDNAVIGIYAMYREYFKISKGAGLYLCPSNEEFPEMGMIKALNMLAGLLDTHRYMVKEERFIPEEALAQLIQWRNKFTRYIIGPPFLIHRFIRFLKATKQRLSLDKDTLIITLGGWKHFTGQIISRKAFNEECAELLGIDPSQVRDMYGLVESNILAIEDEFQVKHAAPYGHYSVRHPDDLSKEVPDGEKGVLAILDPTSTSTPGMLLTEDIVYLVPEKSPSGRSGQRMQYVMRAPSAKEFGCCAVNLEKEMGQKEDPVHSSAS
jgi:phenylacetate-coenzyme A ligase PaaK-like adenylate-forming protein